MFQLPDHLHISKKDIFGRAGGPEKISLSSVNTGAETWLPSTPWFCNPSFLSHLPTARAVELISSERATSCKRLPKHSTNWGKVWINKRKLVLHIDTAASVTTLTEKRSIRMENFFYDCHWAFCHVCSRTACLCIYSRRVFYWKIYFGSFYIKW